MPNPSFIHDQSAASLSVADRLAGYRAAICRALKSTEEGKAYWLQQLEQDNIQTFVYWAEQYGLILPPQKTVEAETLNHDANGYLLYEFTTSISGNQSEQPRLIFDGAIPNITWLDDADNVLASGRTPRIQIPTGGINRIRCYLDAPVFPATLDHDRSSYLQSARVPAYQIREIYFQLNRGQSDLTLDGPAYSSLLRLRRMDLPLNLQVAIIQSIIDATITARTDNPLLDMRDNPNHNQVPSSLIAQLTNLGWSYL